MAKAKGDPIHIKPENKGKLHRALDVPAGKPIPAGKLEKAENSKNPKLREEANFAKNAKSFKRK